MYLVSQECFRREPQRERNPKKGKTEEGALWCGEWEAFSVVLARRAVAHTGIHGLGPGYMFRNAHSF